MQCKAGGTFNPANGLNQHTTGSTDDYDFFLNGDEGKLNEIYLFFPFFEKILKNMFKFTSWFHWFESQIYVVQM